MSIYRDPAEELLDGWRAALAEGDLDDVREELAALPSVQSALEPAVDGPTRAHDIGTLLEAADHFALLGVARNDLGTRALEVSRACYREIQRWPAPWTAHAMRSSVSRAFQRTSRAHPFHITEEIGLLERALAAPLDERPWQLGALHWSKLRHEWRMGIEDGELPSLDGPARVAMSVARDLPELGAVVATAVFKLHADFVEASRFTEERRAKVARELGAVRPVSPSRTTTHEREPTQGGHRLDAPAHGPRRMTDAPRARRFVRDLERDDDHEEREVVDLLLDERTLRTTRRRVIDDAARTPKTSKRQYASRGAAERALASAIEELRAEGYLEDDPVVPAAPPSSDEIARAIAARVARRERMDTAAAEVIAAWTARGYDVTRSFIDQCRGLPTRTHPSELAAQCMQLAETAFGVTFPRKTRSIEAHGWITTIGARRLHEHYRSPLFVIALAQHHLERGGASTDDADVTVRELALRKKLSP